MPSCHQPDRGRQLGGPEPTPRSRTSPSAQPIVSRRLAVQRRRHLLIARPSTSPVTIWRPRDHRPVGGRTTWVRHAPQWRQPGPHRRGLRATDVVHDRKRLRPPERTRSTSRSSTSAARGLRVEMIGLAAAAVSTDDPIGSPPPLGGGGPGPRVRRRPARSARTTSGTRRRTARPSAASRRTPAGPGPGRGRRRPPSARPVGPPRPSCSSADSARDRRRIPPARRRRPRTAPARRVPAAPLHQAVDQPQRQEREAEAGQREREHHIASYQIGHRLARAQVDEVGHQVGRVGEKREPGRAERPRGQPRRLPAGRVRGGRSTARAATAPRRAPGSTPARGRPSAHCRSTRVSARRAAERRREGQDQQRAREPPSPSWPVSTPAIVWAYDENRPVTGSNGRMSRLVVTLCVVSGLLAAADRARWRAAASATTPATSSRSRRATCRTSASARTRRRPSRPARFRARATRADHQRHVQGRQRPGDPGEERRPLLLPKKQ